ncbi:MAG: enoyl-CoA hydratase/isomerase family protein [Ilumatobacter sp.]|nr:enoyl-CoA hydratase/isomerase family protein [Ilumatobacter sp.]
MIDLEKHDHVFVMHLGDGDNRFNRDTVDRLNVALDEIERAEPPAALVTTASGKIWSNGLDLDFMATLDDFVGFVGEVQALMARLLELPMPTVAAIQGHAFAGGAMFALAHDVRVMREDRGYICLPEVDLGMPFGAGFAALIGAKLPQPARHRATVLGERFPAPTARQLGIVDRAAPEGEVLSEAVGLAGELVDKAKPVMTTIRADFYGNAIAALKGE